MLKDFDTELVDLDDNPIENEKGEPIRLKTICVNALLGQPDQENPTGEEKVRRYILATRIHKGGEQEVSSEEITLIKQLVGKSYAPLVVGQVFEIMER